MFAVATEIPTYQQRLVAGAEFQKYATGRTKKIDRTFVAVSKDLTTVFWGDKKQIVDDPKAVKKSMNITEILMISPGKETENFKRFGSEKASVCFSLVGKDRTLDLEVVLGVDTPLSALTAPPEAQRSSLISHSHVLEGERDFWVRAFRWLTTRGKESSPAMPVPFPVSPSTSSGSSSVGGSQSIPPPPPPPPPAVASSASASSAAGGDMPPPEKLSAMFEDFMEERCFKPEVRARMRMLPADGKWKLIVQANVASATDGKQGNRDPSFWVHKLYEEQVTAADMRSLRVLLGTSGKTWLQQFTEVDENQRSGLAGLLSILSKEKVASLEDAMKLEILGCFKALMNNEFGLHNILRVDLALVVHAMTTFLEASGDQVTMLALDLLLVICWVSDEGHRTVLRAFNHARFKRRYEVLVNLLSKTAKGSVVTIETKALTFINALINAPHAAAERLAIRQDMQDVKLNEAVDALRDWIFANRGDHMQSGGFSALLTQCDIYAEMTTRDLKETAWERLDLHNPDAIYFEAKRQAGEQGYSNYLLYTLQGLLTVPHERDFAEIMWKNIASVIQAATNHETEERTDDGYPTPMSYDDLRELLTEKEKQHMGEYRSQLEAERATIEKLRVELLDARTAHETLEKQGATQREAAAARESELQSKLAALEKDLSDLKVELQAALNRPPTVIHVPVPTAATTSAAAAAPGAPPAAPPLAGVPPAPPMFGVPSAPPLAGVPPAPPLFGVPTAPPLGGIPAAPPLFGGAPPAPPLAGGIPPAPALFGVPAAPPLGGVPPAPPLSGIPPAPSLGGVPAAPPLFGAPPAPPLFGGAPPAPPLGIPGAPPLAPSLRIPGAPPLAPALGVPGAPPLAPSLGVPGAPPLAPALGVPGAPPLAPGAPPLAPGAPPMMMMAMAPPAPLLPPKKAVKPTVTMKQLHWAPVDEQKVLKSFWKDAADDKVPLDVKDIESRFCAKPRPVAQPKQAAEKVKEEKKEAISVVDKQRAYGINIILARLRLPPAAIRDALLQLDTSVLNEDRVPALLKCIPQPDEIDGVLCYKEEELTGVERYFHVISAVPNLQTRLELLDFKQRFNPQITELERSLKLFEEAVKAVRVSTNLRSVLEVVLAVGNYINGGTKKGGIYGFRLETLGKLDMTKSADGKSSLLHYVVEVVKSKRTSSRQFVSEIACVESVLRLELANLQTESGKLTGTLRRLENEVKKSKANPAGPHDKFAAIMGPFAETAVKSGKEVADRVAAVIKDGEQLVSFFGEDSASMKVEDLFKLVFNFSRDFAKAEGELENMEKQQAKAAKEAEEREKRLAEKKQKEAKDLVRTGVTDEKSDGVIVEKIVGSLQNTNANEIMQAIKERRRAQSKLSSDAAAETASSPSGATTPSHKRTLSKRAHLIMTLTSMRPKLAPIADQE